MYTSLLSVFIPPVNEAKSYLLNCFLKSNQLLPSNNVSWLSPLSPLSFELCLSQYYFLSFNSLCSFGDILSRGFSFNCKGTILRNCLYSFLSLYCALVLRFRREFTLRRSFMYQQLIQEEELQGWVEAVKTDCFK